MFKQVEIVLTTLYLVLSAALLAAMALRIRGALIRRAARMPIWDQRVGIAYRAGKLALAASLLLLAPGVIYTLSIVILYTAVVKEFFANQPKAGKSVVLNLDGKTLRGTIPAGKTKGVHLLGAYLPEEGWVLFQVEVGSWENEIPAAMRILRQLDLRGKIVTGDALLAQRQLSTHIVEAGGDFVWTVKGNQSRTQDDIELLFAPESCVPGFSPSHKDFQTATTREKGHGRLERRTLTASSLLKDYVNWPYVEQVFRIERRFLRMRDGKLMEEVNYGLTSLTATEADPDRLLQLVRAHWGIENKLHYRRDETLQEDRCRITGQGARAMAVINNLVLGLLRRRRDQYVPDARRFYAANIGEAAALILHSPARA